MNTASLKTPQFPRECLKKTNTKPRTPKVSFGASRDVSRSLPERDWEEDGRNGKRAEKAGRGRRRREEELGRVGGAIGGEAGSSAGKRAEDWEVVTSAVPK